jgi:TatD DNase family protein
MMILVDSHCHLDPEFFPPEEVEAVLKKAEDANVKYVQTICTTNKGFAGVHAVAKKYPNVFCSYGIHPHNVAEEEVTYDDILKNAQKEKVISIGETGLDYFYEHSPREQQKESFRMHLEAARELDLPVIIHTRDAEEDTMKILDATLEKGPLKLLFHCFSSQVSLAEYAIKKGIYLSASGILTFKKSDEIREAFKKAPLELLLVETDAPYLAPVPHRGKRNEPAFTYHTAEFLADLHGIPIEKLAEVTTNNFFKLFSKATR